MANDKIRHLRYEPLRKQLQEIPYWPHRYVHKIIGRNGEAFKKGVAEFLVQFPQVEQKNEGESRNATYLSYTFELRAQHVDEIIGLWVASEEIPDCIKIL